MPEYLNRDSILQADDFQTEDVDCPEWGGTVRIKGMSGDERDSYQAACMQERPVLDAKGKVVRGQTEYKHSLLNMRAKLVVRSIVDENGDRVFKDTDAAALGKKSSAALDRCFDVAARLSGMSDQDVEDLAGKSEAAQSGDSPSSLPEKLGQPSVRHLLRQITSAEFAEWMALYSIEAQEREEADAAAKRQPEGGR